MFSVIFDHNTVSNGSLRVNCDYFVKFIACLGRSKINTTKSQSLFFFVLYEYFLGSNGMKGKKKIILKNKIK